VLQRVISSCQEEAKLVKVQAVENGKSVLSAASAQLAVACVFSHDATYDAGSVASSGRTGTSFNSDEKASSFFARAAANHKITRVLHSFVGGARRIEMLRRHQVTCLLLLVLLNIYHHKSLFQELQSEFEQEQDLSGFDEDLDKLVIGPRSQWKKWWPAPSSRKGAADEHTYEHGNGSSGGGGGDGDGTDGLSSIRGLEPLSGIAEVRESMMAEDGDESPNPLVAPDNGQGGNNSSNNSSSSRRGFGTSGLSSSSGGSKGASGSIRGMLFSGSSGSGNGGGGGGNGSAADAKARMKAEKAAAETAVAELLRSEGMPQLIGRVEHVLFLLLAPENTLRLPFLCFTCIFCVHF